MTERKRILTGVLAAAALIAPVAAVSANHVRIDGMPSAVPPPPPVVSQRGVVVPGPATTQPQTLHVDEIEAGVVRANIIYANKLEADEVRGVVHQSRGLQVNDSHGKIKAPDVAASVIYADEISANTVVADQIYVRELKRH
jgi:hypothetical protein